jgi:hypothetical protein
MKVMQISFIALFLLAGLGMLLEANGTYWGIYLARVGVVGGGILALIMFIKQITSRTG